MSDVFEFKAPQFHERLDEVARRCDTDSADDFFDCSNSSPAPSSTSDEFFTPLLPLGPIHVENVPKMNLFGEEDGDETLVADGAPREESEAMDVIAPGETPIEKTAIESELDCQVQDAVQIETKDKSEPHLPISDSQGEIGNDAKVEEKPRVLKAARGAARARPVAKPVQNKVAVKRSAPTEIYRPAKFRSMAEAIMHFQCDTPPRFRMKPSVVPSVVGSEQKPKEKLIEKRTLTKPESPYLATRERARRTILPSKIDKENSTENAHVRPTSSRKSRSKSVPRSNLKIMGQDENGQLIMKPDNTFIGMKWHVTCNKPTEVKPFSFDKRNCEAREKLEEKLRKLREVKMSKFKAQPLPSYMRRRSRSLSPTSSSSSTIAQKSEPKRRPLASRSTNVTRAVRPLTSSKVQTKTGESMLDREKRFIKY